MPRVLKTTGVSIMVLALFSPPAFAQPGKEKYPFFPSLINTDTGKPVPSDAYERPERCRSCHREIYTQWDGSMHSNAFPDPVFQALWRLGEIETKGAVRNLCAGCHTPIGTVGEEVTFDPGASPTAAFKAGETAMRGVQCDFCHTVKDTTWMDTPTAMPQNASLLVQPGKVKRGPYKDSQAPGHETAFSELHTSAEFCGSCHHVFHPVTNFPIERTYDEWRTSVYAKAGIVCQDCHMMPVEKAVETARTLMKQANPGRASPLGPQRDQVYTHEFVGGNFTVPALMGAQTHSDMAAARLRSAAELEVIGDKAVTGDVARFKVKVTNIGAGHNLPTSLTEVREMWLDVQVVDEKGKVLYRSGAIDVNGDVDADADMFHSVAVDEAGHHTFKPWEITRFDSFRTIPPKGSDTSDYAFKVPDDLKKGKLTVTAVLRYRSFPQSLANLLLGDTAPRLPVVDMVSGTAVLEVAKK